MGSFDRYDAQSKDQKKQDQEDIHSLLGHDQGIPIG